MSPELKDNSPQAPKAALETQISSQAPSSASTLDRPTSPAAQPLSAAPPPSRWENWAWTLIVLLITLGGFLFRYNQLERRPLHTDEAVHMVKAGILLETGKYVYDAHEYHGPILYYLSLPLLWWQHVTRISQMPNARPFLWIPLLFGTALIPALLLLRRAMGWRTVTLTALLTAVSPAMVFYSRYFIQETLFVFFTLTFLASLWRYGQSRRLGWALLAGVSAGLLCATKETCALVFACAMASGGTVLLWNEKSPRAAFHRLRAHVRPWHLALAALVGALLGSAILSGGFTHPSAVLDFLSSYTGYLHRASTGDSNTHGAASHIHPWYFYLRRLVYFKDQPGPYWSEGLIVGLSLVGTVGALLGRVPQGASKSLLRFLALFSALLTLLYTAIPYKTPWNALGFLHTMILLAGVGAVLVLERLPGLPLKLLASALLVLGVWNLTNQSARTSFRFCADCRNPYVYAGTSADLLNLVRRVEDLARLRPEGNAMTVQVVAPGSDYWPLPWYLRRFENAGFYDQLPEKLDATVIVTTPALAQQLSQKLDGAYYKEFFGLRAGVLLNLYVRQELWDSFIRTRQEAS